MKQPNNLRRLKRKSFFNFGEKFFYFGKRHKILFSRQSSEHEYLREYFRENPQTLSVFAQMFAKIALTHGVSKRE